MRNTEKMGRVSSYYQNKRNSIVFLQETYTAHGDIDKRKTVWKDKIFLATDIDKIVVDPEGRYLIIEVWINDNDLALCNYYTRQDT